MEEYSHKKKKQREMEERGMVLFIKEPPERTRGLFSTFHD